MKKIIVFMIIAMLLCVLSMPAAPVNSGYAESTTPTVYNVTVTDNSTEYSQAIPDGTKILCFHCRDGSVLRYAFVTGKVATPTAPYMTCLDNEFESYSGILTDNLTLYLATPTSGKVVEIICW